MLTPLNSRDDELFAAFKAGDNRAYQFIYERYWQVLFRCSRKMLQNDMIAKDVVQDIYHLMGKEK